MACVLRATSQVFLDLQQTVVFGNALAAAGGAGFDLTRASGNAEIRNCRIIGLA